MGLAFHKGMVCVSRALLFAFERDDLAEARTAGLVQAGAVVYHCHNSVHITLLGMAGIGFGDKFPVLGE